MQRLELDFVRRRTRTGAGILFLGLGIMAAGASVVHFQALRRDANLWEAKLDDLRQLTQRKTVSIGSARRDGKPQPEEIKRANLVLEQMAVPWGVLFSELEATADDELTLLAIQPDVSSRRVRIAGIAASLPVVIRFVTRLEAQPHLVGVHLVEHELRSSSPGKPVAFSIVGSWVNGS